MVGEGLVRVCFVSGRLKPDSVHDTVRVIVDGQGDIGTITREGLAEILSGIEPQPVLSFGEADLSELARGLKVTIPVEVPVYVLVAEQVGNLLEKWLRNKAAGYMVKTVI